MVYFQETWLEFATLEGSRYHTSSKVRCFQEVDIYKIQYVFTQPFILGEISNDLNSKVVFFSHKILGFVSQPTAVIFFRTEKNHPLILFGMERCNHPRKGPTMKVAPLKTWSFASRWVSLLALLLDGYCVFLTQKKTEIGSVVLFFLILPGLSPPEFPSVVDSPLDLGEPFEPEKNPYKMARWIQL